MKLLEFLHVKPGKGSAFVRSKVKNLVNGSVQEKTFRAGESMTAADITKTEMQYTFTDGNLIVFMNMETFEEERVDKAKISNLNLLKEGTRYSDKSVLELRNYFHFTYCLICRFNFRSRVYIS